MADTPIYSFYRSPRFSANHIAEYLCTTDANQRAGVIRMAKFPRRLPVAAYQQIVPYIRQFFSSNSWDASIFGGIVATLQRKATSPDEGYDRDEARRCLSAIDAFNETFAQAKFGKSIF